MGITNNLPKLLTFRLLGPALAIPDYPVHLVCEQDGAERLVAELSIHRLDMVLSDAPLSLLSDTPARSVQIGESGVSLFAAPEVAARLRGGLPGSLMGAPVLLPDASAAMRGPLEVWFQDRGILPRVVAEFGDSALLKTFGGEGVGVFPAPTVVAGELMSQHGVERLLDLAGVVERFYAIVHPTRESNRAVKQILSSVMAWQSLGAGREEGGI